MDIMRLEWHVDDVSGLEAIKFLTKTLTHEIQLSADGLQDQKNVKRAPSFVGWHHQQGETRREPLCIYRGGRVCVL